MVNKYKLPAYAGPNAASGKVEILSKLPILAKITNSSWRILYHVSIR